MAGGDFPFDYGFLEEDFGIHRSKDRFADTVNSRRRLGRLAYWSRAINRAPQRETPYSRRWTPARRNDFAFELSEAKREMGRRRPTSPTPTSGGGQSRPRVTMSPRPARGGVDMRTGEIKKFFDQPRQHRPGDNPRDRLGALTGRQQAGKKGGTWGGYGGSGIKGVRSSYTMRSLIYTARNPLARVRLAGPGFAALLIGQIGQEESNALDRYLVTPKAEGGAGRDGGFLSLSQREQEQVLAGRGEFAGSRERVAGLGRIAYGRTAQAAIGLGLAYTSLKGWIGGSPSGTVAGQTAHLKRQSMLWEAWVEGGSERREEVRRQLDSHGGPLAYRAAMQRAEAYDKTKNSVSKFIVDASNTFAGSIIGVSGSDIAEELIADWDKNFGGLGIGPIRKDGKDIGGQARVKELNKWLGVKE